MKVPDYYKFHLPLTYNPLTLFYYYSDRTDNYTDEEYRFAVHDLSVYPVPENLNDRQFVAALSEVFLGHPVIEGLIREIEQEDFLYYGRVRGWIKNQCLDIPAFSRKELVQATLTLYKWFEVLGAHRFRVDRPNLGQRISIVK